MEPREASSWGHQQTLSWECNLCRYEESNVNRLQSHQIIFQTVQIKVHFCLDGYQEHHSIFWGRSCSPGDNLRRRRILVAGGQDKHCAHTTTLLSTILTRLVSNIFLDCWNELVEISIQTKVAQKRTKVWGHLNQSMILQGRGVIQKKVFMMENVYLSKYNNNISLVWACIPLRSALISDCIEGDLRQESRDEASDLLQW